MLKAYLTHVENLLLSYAYILKSPIVFNRACSQENVYRMVAFHCVEWQSGAIPYLCTGICIQIDP